MRMHADKLELTVVTTSLHTHNVLARTPSPTRPSPHASLPACTHLPELLLLGCWACWTGGAEPVLLAVSPPPGPHPAPAADATGDTGCAPPPAAVPAAAAAAAAAVALVATAAADDVDLLVDRSRMTRARPPPLRTSPPSPPAAPPWLAAAAERPNSRVFADLPDGVPQLLPAVGAAAAVAIASGAAALRPGATCFPAATEAVSKGEAMPGGCARPMDLEPSLGLAVPVLSMVLSSRCCW